MIRPSLRSALALTLVPLVGCLTVLGDFKIGDAPAETPDGDLPDTGASPPAEDVADTGVLDAGRTCAHTAPFQKVVPVAGVNSSAHERDPFLTSDELTLYFSRAPATGTPAQQQAARDIFVARRTSVDLPFATPELVTSLRSDVSDVSLSLDPAGRAALLTRDVHVFADGGINPNHGIYRADWDGGAFGFSKVRKDNLAAYAGALKGATVTGQVTRNIYQVGDSIIYVAEWDSVNSVYAPARQLDKAAPDAAINIQLPGDPYAIAQGWPSLSRDEKAMYFTRVTTPTTALPRGSYLFVAERDSVTAPFKPAHFFPELVVAGSGGNVSSWISDDACRLYFASPRPGGEGGEDLWMATR